MTTTARHDPDSAPDLSYWRFLAPSRLWACAELVAALAVIIAGLRVQHVAFMLGSTPWLVVLGMFLLWWRGPGLRSIGLGRPPSVTRTVGIGVLVGIGYQFVGTFAIEPVVAKWTTGVLPDVSQFRSVIGNECQLAYWMALSWTLAALLEEIAFRGWLVTRVAELGLFSRAAWIVGVVATSVLFGVVHFYQGLSGVIATGLTSLVFGSVYLATRRNLWASVMAHGMLDTTGFMLMYLGVYPGI